MSTFYVYTKDVMSYFWYRNARESCADDKSGREPHSSVDCCNYGMDKQCPNLDYNRTWGIHQAMWCCLFPTKASENHLPLV